MYSPIVKSDLIRPLYRLAKVRGVPMTHVVNDVLSRHLDESKNEIADLDGSGNVIEFRYFALGTMDGILGFTRGSQTYFALLDPSGNIAMVVDESANVVARYAYEPFGLRSDAGFDSIANRFRFAARRQEASGEIFVRARSFESVTGRFMQRDPLFFGNTLDPFSWQGFIYANSDPINRHDPTGEACKWQETNSYDEDGKNWKEIYVQGFGGCSLGPCYRQRQVADCKRNVKSWILTGTDANGHPCPPKTEVTYGTPSCGPYKNDGKPVVTQKPNPKDPNSCSGDVPGTFGSSFSSNP